MKGSSRRTGGREPEDEPARACLRHRHQVPAQQAGQTPGKRQPQPDTGVLLPGRGHIYIENPLGVLRADPGTLIDQLEDHGVVVRTDPGGHHPFPGGVPDGVAEQVHQNLLDSMRVTHVTGVPDSTFGPWFDALRASSAIRLVPVCREGEAWAVAGGLHLGGARPLVMMQCTGLFESGVRKRTDAAERMGQNGRRAVLRLYRWEDQARRMTDFYAGLLSPGGAPAMVPSRRPDDGSEGLGPGGS